MTDIVLSTDKLCKSFRVLKACDHVSLDLRAGEIHALIGPNGAGKSTLIRQISGGLEPDSGDVRLLGDLINKKSIAQRAKLGLARTFQISALATEYSVLENVMLSAMGRNGHVFDFFKPVRNDKTLLTPARQTLERVGLIEFENSTVSELSHGQRRQLEIAIALTLSPKAFLMDEPMAGMGADGSKRLTKLLKELKKEAPILLVEHDMDAVFALADRISVLVYGKIIATGTAAEIRANSDVQSAYLGSDFEEGAH